MPLDFFVPSHMRGKMAELMGKARDEPTYENLRAYYTFALSGYKSIMRKHGFNATLKESIGHIEEQIRILEEKFPLPCNSCEIPHTTTNSAGYQRIVCAPRRGTPTKDLRGQECPHRRGD